MLGMTWLQNRYTRFSTKQAEEFSTASRSVKPGLIAAGIVSCKTVIRSSYHAGSNILILTIAWTWSATLLTSSTFAYSYGISGGMWYASMGTFQILLFSFIAIKIKSNAPGAHTFPGEPELYVALSFVAPLTGLQKSYTPDMGELPISSTCSSAFRRTCS